MANKNPTNKFTKGNKAATVNKGKRKRTSVIKQLLKDADAIGSQFGNIVEFRKLIYLGYYAGLTHPKKEIRINTAVKLGDYVDPKKKIVDAGDGLTKILEVQRPLEMIINSQGNQPGLFDTVAPDKKTEKAIIDVRKKISDIAKRLRDEKQKKENLNKKKGE